MTQDIILYWNEVALEANKMSHTTGEDGKLVNGPTMSSRAAAIVHLAMYDAFVGTDSTTTLTSYLGIADTVNASVSAAISAAANATLSKLYPSQKAFFETKHKQAKIEGTTDEVNKGHKYGQDIANEILKIRKDDLNSMDDGYSSYPSHGTHRPDPINPTQGYHGAFYGASKLFSSGVRYQLDTPPLAADSNAVYKKALKQVRAKGIATELMGTLPSTYEKRTVEETIVGLFWGYDGAKGLGTPPRLYNQIIREIAMFQGNTLEENAHLFALINVAMGDSGILSWEQKYKHNYWRPVLGIREHDTSMGPLGTGDNTFNDDSDPLWCPLGAPNTNKKGEPNFTPPFPAYPSGHATFGGAVFEISKKFYEKKYQGKSNNIKKLQAMFDTISFVSDELNGVNTDNTGVIRPKHYRKFLGGFDQMILENGLSRVWLGVHWSFDAFILKNDGSIDLTKNTGGVPLGIKIANDVFDGGMGIQKSSV